MHFDMPASLTEAGAFPEAGLPAVRSPPALSVATLAQILIEAWRRHDTTFLPDSAFG